MAEFGPHSYQPRERLTTRTTSSITGTSISTPTTVANAAFLFAASPLIAALLGRIVLHERVAHHTLLAIALVMGAEALNTALEYVVDLASPEWHALARDAKDVAAAAVLVCSTGAAVVGLVVFVPYLF